MDLRSIVLSLKMKRMESRIVDNDLVTILHDEPVRYAMVTLWLRRDRLARFSEPSHHLAEEPQVRETDRAILSALTPKPFASVPDITRLTCRLPSSVNSYLTRSLPFTVSCLRWIPHRMTNERKHNRVRDSQARPEILQAEQRRSWHDIVALDQSWFYLNTDHEQIWLAPGEALPDRERQAIQSPKFMLTVVWSVTGIHVIKLLPKESTFNSCYDIDEILSEIAP
jgi:hypothetical protein